MGLDVVELVMAFEEKFAITIPDAEAEKMGTPRHVIDFIYANVQHADSKTCLSQRAFYRLRRALQQELGLGRNAVRPTTTLNAIIPLNERQSVWERIKRAAGIGRWPRLVRSQQVVLGCGLASLAVGFVVYAANPPFPDWMAVLAATGSATALAGRLSTYAFTSLRPKPWASSLSSGSRKTRRHCNYRTTPVGRGSKFARSFGQSSSTT